jgi:hypothetical protein
VLPIQSSIIGWRVCLSPKLDHQDRVGTMGALASPQKKVFGREYKDFLLQKVATQEDDRQAGAEFA